jgi:hypothetical protein
MMSNPKSKAMAAIIVAKLKPKSDGKDAEIGASKAEMQHCSEKMMEAMHSKDAAGFNDALHTWFQHAENVPHDEADHEDAGHDETQPKSEGRDGPKGSPSRGSDTY